MKNPLEETYDVVIVGSGPIGCGFARTLLDEKIHLLGATAPAKLKVLMVDIGQQLSSVPGENLKNAYYYQRNVNNFTPVVQGTMQPISVSPNSQPLPYPADPTSFQPEGRSFVINNINSKQDEAKNMPSAATTYAVGGMATHWTCCIPRTAEGVERPQDALGVSNTQWNELYPLAEMLFNKHTDIFEMSVRQRALKAILCDIPKFRDRCVEMPIAGERRTTGNTDLITWAGADTVLGPLKDAMGVKGLTAGSGLFIAEQHRCTKLNWIEKADGTKHVDYAVVRNLQTDVDYNVKAKFFVIAANPILTPQLLWNSKIRPKALGCYLMDQPMTFCQVLLSNAVIDRIESISQPNGKPSSARKRARQRNRHTRDANDPVGMIPITDPPPALILKVTKNPRWHAQIHKDTFSYGMVPQSLDPRLVLDLRWFGTMTPDKNNKVTFADPDTREKDLMGMPQPTFAVKLSTRDEEEQHEMMAEMTEVALLLGGFLPGAEPRCMPLGTSLHFQGTTRYGPTDDGTSVCDPHCRVWKTTNVYVGGNGCIPTPIACNPTLTSLCLAINAARNILSSLKAATL